MSALGGKLTLAFGGRTISLSAGGGLFSMSRYAVCIVVAAIISSGCKSQAPAQISGGCPPFPLTGFDQKGGAMAYTSFGGSVRHSPPTHHINIPDGPLDGVRIILERGGCYGTCPGYRAELRGTGEVLFSGTGFVTFPGDHQSRISPQVIECLLQDFRMADFWSLDPEYVANVTDLPTYKISLTIGGKTKVLTDYAGQSVGMPAAVTGLEEAIDQAASTDTWIKGNDKTIPALEAEHFDFHGRDAADLLATAAQDAPDDVVSALLEHGAPVDGRTREGEMNPRRSAVEVAAMVGRVALVKGLIAAGAFSKGGKALISATLRSSVASQRADMVAEILKYHPDVNSPDKRGDTALALIFTGPHPNASDKDARDESAAIIKMLGKAGANPNLPNSEQESLLDLAYSKEDKDALIAIGSRPKN
jgi:hypothetical protein